MIHLGNDDMLSKVLRSCLLLAALLGGPAVHAQAPAETGTPRARPEPATPTPPALKSLPADVTTHHTLDLPGAPGQPLGRTLHFSATAGAIRVVDDKGAPRADVAFIAYQLDGAEARSRKVTFALNGGPGFASGWLQVGAVGPWRIPLGGPMGDGATAPSASPEPLPNAETWLDFTDLVFIDPVDTGYSRALTSNDDARKRLFSVEGDISYLAEVIRRWLDRFDRSVSPKYVLGESYGGFRAPRLARELASVQGVGLSGLVLVSPALDIGGRNFVFDPFFFASRLPSMAAAARAAHGPAAGSAGGPSTGTTAGMPAGTPAGPTGSPATGVTITRAQLADVEQYAATDFLVDATKGESDPAAIERRSARVAAFTGLDPALVRRYHGLIGNDVFLHEMDRAAGRVGSAYDATITTADPWPLWDMSEYADPVLEGLQAPVGSAMVAIYETQLNWRPEYSYRLLSQTAGRQWDWGHGWPSQPQSVAAMRTALALDPHLRVLIAHGLFDLVTPYFRTQLLLDQIPRAGLGERVRLVTYPGGHMFYSQDASRAGFREDARKLFAGE
jgi:carboxypeptidase C (cathepsin A)